MGACSKGGIFCVSYTWIIRAKNSEGMIVRVQIISVCLNHNLYKGMVTVMHSMFSSNYPSRHDKAVCLKHIYFIKLIFQFLNMHALMLIFQ